MAISVPLGKSGNSIIEADEKECIAGDFPAPCVVLLKTRVVLHYWGTDD